MVRGVLHHVYELVMGQLKHRSTFARRGGTIIHCIKNLFFYDDFSLYIKLIQGSSRGLLLSSYIIAIWISL